MSNAGKVEAKEKDDDMLSSVLSQLAERFWQAKIDFVKEKMKEKNYGHLIESMHGVFPRVRCVVYDGWECWFADNNTLTGVFIVRLKNNSPTHGYDQATNQHTANMSFIHDDELPKDFWIYNAVPNFSI